MPVGGVLWVKPNGTGMLVQPANNYVPQQTDAIVPRSTVEKLHLQQGLTSNRSKGCRWRSTARRGAPSRN